MNSFEKRNEYKINGYSDCLGLKDFEVYQAQYK